jgi:hypothetical protein
MYWKLGHRIKRVYLHNQTDQELVILMIALTLMPREFYRVRSVLLPIHPRLQMKETPTNRIYMHHSCRFFMETGAFTLCFHAE